MGLRRKSAPWSGAGRQISRKSSVNTKSAVGKMDQETTIIGGDGYGMGRVLWPRRVSVSLRVPANSQQVFHFRSPPHRVLSWGSTPVSGQNPEYELDLAGGKWCPQRGCSGLWARGRAAQAPVPHMLCGVFQLRWDLEIKQPNCALQWKRRS